ncbi:MAG: hypothetical protein ACXAC7_20890, partial [Candidatus Hodarchaeales archaeon]
MSFLLRLLGFKRISADVYFMKAMDSFAEKDYSISFKLFMKAFKATKNNRMKINSLTNAASALENSNDYYQASQLLFHQVTKLQVVIKDPPKKILITLQKSFDLCTKASSNNMLGEISGPLMFYSIATKEIYQAKQLYQKLENNNITHPHIIFAKKIYDLLQDHSSSILEQKTSLIDLPPKMSEHSYLIENVEDIIKSTSAISLDLIIPSENRTRVGEYVDIILKIKNFIPLTIKNIIFNPGGKGMVRGGLEENQSLNLTSNQKIQFDFKLDAQLTGNWIAGPVKIVYVIKNNEYDISSETI